MRPPPELMPPRELPELLKLLPLLPLLLWVLVLLLPLTEDAPVLLVLWEGVATFMLPDVVACPRPEVVACPLPVELTVVLVLLTAE